MTIGNETVTFGANYPDWIGNLPPEIRAAIEARMVPVKLPAGAMLYERNAPSNGVYRLREGRIRLFFMNDSGCELVLKTMEPPETIGELASLDGQPRQVFAETVTDCRLDLLPTQDFNEMRRLHPSIDTALLQLLASIARTTLKFVEEAAIFPLRARVAARLCWLVDSAAMKGPATGNLEISQNELALMVGAARQAVNRVLSEFAALGATKTSYGAISIIDIERLRRIATQSE